MMKKHIFSVIILLFVAVVVTVAYNYSSSAQMSGAPPYGETQQSANNAVLPWWASWERPDGPAKVALQVGHWKSEEHPEELKKLRGNTGSQGGGKTEWEVNFEIANLVKEKLEERQITVEILPATVPPKYWADVFLSIHADGSTDTTKSGYKVAGPWRDFTNNSDELVRYLENSYESSTGLDKDPNITRNMRGYYAFSWWRYEHAIHPMTTAAIIETGFLTSPSDRELLIGSPESSADGIFIGLIAYLESQELI